LKYEVKLSKRAYRELDSLDLSLRQRILDKLEELQEDPFPRGAVKLQGTESSYRVRVGDYRILYDVLNKEGLVLINKIDHRSTVYGP